MEQHADLQRTVKTVGSNGLESFTTVHLETLHYESHVMSTNCGPLGIKADVEPSSNRYALVDRSFAQVVHAAGDKDGGDGEFDIDKASVEIKQKVNRLRVIACLVAYVQVFIKHIPHCQPNLTFARELTNKFDDILCDEFNLPKPSKRKKIKRRMCLQLFCIETAVVEKFFYRHTAIDFKDMRPDPVTGHLSSFCIDQIFDVVRSLQRCVNQEVILNAWSHGLTHSHATASHTLQMKTVLSQMHGARRPRTRPCSRLSVCVCAQAAT
tara:strand:- start:88 stop:888 length:801 start_codon:yes stop_codon:yes gene_type:complete